MAMLIAWQTLNRARTRGSSRFTDAFLVVSPGITIRDRLRVLMPSDPNNTYTLHDVVPPDMRDTLQQARVVITNYHAFQRRETMAAPKLSKAILGGRSGPVQSLESEGLMRSARYLLEREALTIEFPRVIGYRTVLPPERRLRSSARRAGSPSTPRSRRPPRATRRSSAKA